MDEASEEPDPRAIRHFDIRFADDRHGRLGGRLPLGHAIFRVGREEDRRLAVVDQVRALFLFGRRDHGVRRHFVFVDQGPGGAVVQLVEAHGGRPLDAGALRGRNSRESFRRKRRLICFTGFFFFSNFIKRFNRSFDFDFVKSLK